MLADAQTQEIAHCAKWAQRMPADALSQAMRRNKGFRTHHHYRVWGESRIVMEACGIGVLVDTREGLARVGVGITGTNAGGIVVVSARRASASQLDGAIDRACAIATEIIRLRAGGWRITSPRPLAGDSALRINHPLGLDRFWRSEVRLFNRATPGTLRALRGVPTTPQTIQWRDLLGRRSARREVNAQAQRELSEELLDARAGLDRLALVSQVVLAATQDEDAKTTMTLLERALDEPARLHDVHSQPTPHVVEF